MRAGALIAMVGCSTVAGWLLFRIIRAAVTGKTELNQYHVHWRVQRLAYVLALLLHAVFLVLCARGAVEAFHRFRQ